MPFPEGRLQTTRLKTWNGKSCLTELLWTRGSAGLQLQQNPSKIPETNHNSLSVGCLWSSFDWNYQHTQCLVVFTHLFSSFSSESPVSKNPSSCLEWVFSFSVWFGSQAQSGGIHCCVQCCRSSRCNRNKAVVNVSAHILSSACT